MLRPISEMKGSRGLEKSNPKLHQGREKHGEVTCERMRGEGGDDFRC